MEQRVGRGRFETLADEDSLLIEIEFSRAVDDLDSVVNGLQMAKLLDLGYPPPESVPVAAPEPVQAELPLGDTKPGASRKG